MGALTRHICRDCNRRLGTLDEIFVRTGPVGALQAHGLALAWRTHHRVVIYVHVSDQGSLCALGNTPPIRSMSCGTSSGMPAGRRPRREIIFQRPSGYYDAITMPKKVLTMKKALAIRTSGCALSRAVRRAGE
jgi:hypothetical protein